jgi:hypothetical protein
MLSLLWWVGCANVHTSGDAPFDLSSTRTALWSVGEEADDQYAAAMLVLSSSEILDCAQLGGASLPEALDKIVQDGTGVLFLLETFGKSEDFTGTWTEDGAFVPSEDGEDPSEGRYFYLYPFEGGYFYELYGAETSWLSLDQVDAKKTTGEFRSDWWWGDFRAEPCPAWDAEAPVTTGYSY